MTIQQYKLRARLVIMIHEPAETLLCQLCYCHGKAGVRWKSWKSRKSREVLEVQEVLEVLEVLEVQEVLEVSEMGAHHARSMRAK
jgi:hypothetical protein